MSRGLNATLVLWLLMGFVAGQGQAQGLPVGPKRLVGDFDFEDTNDQGVLLGRGLELPPAWYPMGRDPQSRDPNFGRLPLHDRLSRRPGFPHHNPVGYSKAGHALSGQYSLHLALDGGNAGAYLEIGTLPVVPGSDYLITAKVCTKDLEHAGARVRAYFVDTAGQRIEPSVRTSPRLRDNAQWVDVSLTLPGEFREAAYIGIEVELVQPNSDPHSILGGQQIVLTDVIGDAWFDDLGVWQLPHIEIATDSPVNVTRSRTGPQWDIAVRDLVGGRLTSRVTVYDHRMNVVAEDSRPMGWGVPSNWHWSPTMPGYGWYLAELSVLEEDDEAGESSARGPSAPATGAAPNTSGSSKRVVARTYNAVLWLPPDARAVGADAERFALVATGMNDRQIKLLPELARKVGLGTVIVSAWDRETTLGTLDLRLDVLQEVIAPLKNAGQRVEISFSPVPEGLEHSRGVNTRLPAGVFAAAQEVWMPYVQPILVKQGQRVNTWHLGSADQPDAAYLPELGQTVSETQRVFRRWTPAPQLAVPWRIDQPARDELVAGDDLAYAVQWPMGVTPDRLSDYMTPGDGWAAAGTSRRLHLRPASAHLVPHQVRVTDLALRMVSAWEQDGTGVALPELWTQGLERRESLLPDPLLGVAANVASQLTGFRAIGRLNLGDDRVGIIFERKTKNDEDPDSHLGEGLLVAWNIKAPASRAKLSMYLGNHPIAHDVWGNTTKLAPNPEDGKHTVALTDTPVFITGINPKLALFRSGFVLDKPFIASTQTPHLRTVRLLNPWPITISGQFTITGPEGWTIKPYRHSFSLGPGRTLELPIAMKFPINEVAGLMQFTADIEFTADRRYQIELAAPLQLGLEGVRFEPSLTLEPGADPGTIDAAVTCIITNVGTDRLSLNLFANLVGHPRKERLIPRLDPGQAVIRQFRFKNAGPALSQNDIRLGVRETNGPTVLNKIVGVNDVE